LSNTLSSTVLEDSVLLADDTTSLGHLFRMFWMDTSLSSWALKVQKIKEYSNVIVKSSKLAKSTNCFFCSLLTKAVMLQTKWLVYLSHISQWLLISVPVLVAFHTNFVTNTQGYSTAVLRSLGAVKVVLGSVSCTSIRLSCPWEYENTNCACMMHCSCLTAADNGLAGADTYIFILCCVLLQIDLWWSKFICEICPLEHQSSYAIILQSVHHGRNVSGILWKIILDNCTM
jgi:hypothetical protein